MPLHDGDSLGPYRVITKIGEGGMGEVYRAVDTRLDREVALKIVTSALTGDREHVARFQREAQVLAQLHHPNIAAIFGLEEAAGNRALVMELVPGPTLADRLASGSLSIEESLAIALQVARGLEEAHDKGIVHRDLKPQNIKASHEGVVKILDFGLAKALEPRSGAALASASALNRSPTLAFGETIQGVILGTAAYMSPEQAKGLPVDRRTDIWAFGAVLWEMLSGRRLFQGDTVAEILAAVLREDIDLGALPVATPPALRQLVGRCLERDAKRRLRDIGEARVLLEGPLPLASDRVPGASEVKRLRRAAVAVGVVALAAIGVAAWGVAGGAAGRGERVVPRAVSRLHLLPPDGLEFGATDGPVALSPDGTSIAFRVDTSEGEGSYLAVRRLESLEATRLPGTEGGYEPFWSPDGLHIGYFGDELSMVDAAGLQPPQALAEIVDGRGASWGPQGILYAPSPGSAIFLVVPGREPRQVTTVDTERGESGHLRPQHLPGGERFLFLVRSEQPEVGGLYVGDFDGGRPKRILPVSVGVLFALPDVLILVQDGRLVARRLDLESLEVGPAAWILAEGVDYVTQYDLPPISVSSNGRLVYHPLGKLAVRQLQRLDRAGTMLETIGDPGDRNLDLSLDGLRLATERIAGPRRSAIWIRDLQHGRTSRLETDGSASGPVWSPDGRHLAYAQVTPTLLRLVIRPAAGGPPRVVVPDPYLVEPVDWSPDGRTLLVEVGNPGERSNLILVAVDGSERTPFAATSATEMSGRFSPDGRHIAYLSDETGRAQIYVEPTQRTGVRWLVSPDGGDAPRWSRDGDSLFYVERGERHGATMLMQVEVTREGDELAFGPARRLGPIASIDYELEESGTILVSVPLEDGAPAQPVLVDGWPALLGSQ